MLKTRLRTIYRSGPGKITLFIGLLITSSLLLVNTFIPLSFENTLLKIIAILLLTMLGELLYLKLEEKSPRDIMNTSKEAGIISIFPRLKGDEFDHILSRPGKK